MIVIRPMTAEDMPQLERLMDADADRRKTLRGTDTGQPGGRILQNRFHKEPSGCFVAEQATHGVIGSVLSVSWGSLAWLGPLTVLPEFSAQGIDAQLVQAVLEYWEPMGLSAQGVEISPNDPSQITLYASLGFRPQFPTATLTGDVNPDAPRQPNSQE